MLCWESYQKVSNLFSLSFPCSAYQRLNYEIALDGGATTSEFLVGLRRLSVLGYLPTAEF